MDLDKLVALCNFSFNCIFQCASSWRFDVWTWIGV